MLARRSWRESRWRSWLSSVWGTTGSAAPGKGACPGRGSHVLFCGFLPARALAALWERVAVFAMPSAREGFGLVYLEAMRAGRPCIGSTSDAAGDIIVDGETGLLVDRANRSALAEALVTLLTNVSMRRQWAKQGGAGIWLSSRPIASPRGSSETSKDTSMSGQRQ